MFIYIALLTKGQNYTVQAGTLLFEHLPETIIARIITKRFDLCVFSFNWKAAKPKREKRTFGHLSPAKIQVSLLIRAIWSESSLGAFWFAKDVVSACGQWRLQSDCADVQAYLRLRWRICQKVRFSQIAAQKWYFFFFFFFSINSNAFAFYVR